MLYFCNANTKINKGVNGYFILAMWLWDTKKTHQKIAFPQNFYNCLEQCLEVLPLLFLELSKYTVVFFSVDAQPTFEKAQPLLLSLQFHWFSLH